MHLHALILAAGLSRRMGRFKPLLRLGECTVLERCVRTFHQAGIGEVTVVAGHRHQEVVRECRRLGVEWTVNPAYEQGMYSSVTAGVAALPQEVDAFFVLPADIPLVRVWTVARTAEVFQEQRPIAAYPCFCGEQGHPPLLSSRLRRSVVEYNGEGGLRRLLERFDDQAVHVETFDRNILLDLDRPEDFVAATDRVQALFRLDRDEAWTLVKRVHPISEAGLAHGLAVGRTAEAMAVALRRGGCDVDPELAFVCGLVHDLAKGLPGHEKAGGELLQGMGLSDMAPIVAAHRDLRLPESGPLTSREVVYLADKVTRGSYRLGVRERFQEKLALYAHDPEAVAAISRRLENALQVKARVEEVLGCPVLEILPPLPSPPDG